MRGRNRTAREVLANVREVQKKNIPICNYFTGKGKKHCEYAISEHAQRTGRRWTVGTSMTRVEESQNE